MTIQEQKNKGLNAYVTVIEPRGIQKLNFMMQFTNVMRDFFENVERQKLEQELDSKNDTTSIVTYSYLTEIYSLYNSEQSDLEMLQSLFEKLEEIRDNTSKTLLERGLAETTHTDFCKALLPCGIISVIYTDK